MVVRKALLLYQSIFSRLPKSLESLGLPDPLVETQQPYNNLKPHVREDKPHVHSPYVLQRYWCQRICGFFWLSLAILVPTLKVTFFNTICSGNTFTNICSFIKRLTYGSKQLKRESRVLKHDFHGVICNE